MYDDYSYLIHSAKGTSWSKKNAKYKKKVKVNGVWKYIYTDKINEATSNYDHRSVDSPFSGTYDIQDRYVVDDKGNKIYFRPDTLLDPNAKDENGNYKEYKNPDIHAGSNNISKTINKTKKISDAANKSLRKTREQSARVNGGKNLAESKERKAREQEAARREKVTRENRERDARINSHKAEMKNTSEARQLKEELTKRGYGNDIKGDVSLEYLRALESNTKKNRW